MFKSESLTEKEAPKKDLFNFKPSATTEKVEEVKQEESKSDKTKFVFNFKPIQFKCDTSKD